jgi:hypothetical protein
MTLGQKCPGTPDYLSPEALERGKEAASEADALKAMADAAKSGKAQLYTFAVLFLRLLLNLPRNEKLVSVISYQKLHVPHTQSKLRSQMPTWKQL